MSRYKPDWNKVMADCGSAHSDDNECVIVTRGTARLAKSAIRQSQKDVAYHNFAHAERELDDALARQAPSAQQKIDNLNAALGECEYYCATQNGGTSCNCGGWYFRQRQLAVRAAISSGKRGIE
jgi:hypothetical protein